MQSIKKLFFTYRNGAVADTLRRYGIPHKVIFGLEIPRIAEIARGLGQDTELAERLWADSEVRESRLLATYLFPPETTTVERAIRLAADTRTQEESDMLAFRLLKRMPDPADILHRLESESESLSISGSESAPASSETPSAAAIRRTAASLRRHLE